MTRTVCALLLGCVLAHAPAVLAAAEGEHHEGIDAKTLALQLLNFGALLFVLIKFAGPALSRAFKARHEQLKTDIEAAAKQKAAAEQRSLQHEQRLANLEKEIAAMQAAIKTEAEQEKARIISAAEERARRLQDDTKFQLDQQIKDAEIRFKQEVAAAAVKIAGELLQKQVGAADEQRLAQTFVADLGNASKGPSRGEAAG